MRKVFLDNLVKQEKGKYKGRINWKKNINSIVKFVYEDICGEVEIINCYRNTNTYLQIKYNNKIYDITTQSFKNCYLGNILGVYTREYKYNIGDIITNVKSGKLKILDQIRIIHGKRNYEKGYKYECLICGNIDKITENSLNQNIGCNACGHYKVLKGYNDIWTTNPNLAKLLFEPQDGYKYTEWSGQKVDWVCPRCGNIIKHRKISQANQYNLNCPKCSDGISYPEKFAFNFLQQLLNNNFTYQLSKTIFKWCNKYKYDFYFELNNENYIIETHGLQHYEHMGRGRSLQEEQLNDRIKKELALANGIKKENYIVIDCRESKLEWIKDKIINSELNNIFDLNIINWLKCEEFACNSLVKEVCELWNKSIHNTKEIGKIMKLSRSTVTKYLRKGTKLKWCNYNSKEELRKNGTKNIQVVFNTRKVICLNNKKIFDSITKAKIYCNLKSSGGITSCCQGKQNYAGKSPITGERLHWMYYKDYEKLNEKYA